MPHSNPAVRDPAAIDPDELLRQCDEKRTRRGGPGGQHRNKVETAVVLHQRPTGMTAEASKRRSIAENRHIGLHRLRFALAITYCTVADPGGPTDLRRSRVKDGRLLISPDHEHYPALLAEASNQLVLVGWQLPPAVAYRGAGYSSGCSRAHGQK
jgi:hypothetical protein